MAAIANLALSDESHSLTSEELQFYNALKDELGAGISDDFAIRVTRAFRSNKKNRMQVTIEEGKKILQWRAQYDLDNILLRQLDRSKIYNDSWPTWIYGEDCQGHLVAVDRVGDIQIDKFQANFDTVEKLIEHRAQYMERIQWEKAAISKRLGHRIYRHICIVDLKGLCMKHLSRSVIAQLKPIFDLGQLYYPETLQRLYIVNAPAIFYGAWKVISALIDPEVREKIQVFVSQFLCILA
jgi:hypothetical protein